ncbi:transmembrane protein 209-like isoform X2 [Rhinoderma darwinii]
MKKRRKAYGRDSVPAWGLLNAYLAGTIYTVMAFIDTSYWTSHRTVCFIGLALAALFSLNALGVFQKFFKTSGRRLRCSKDRHQGAPNSFRGFASAGRPFVLAVRSSPSSIYTKGQRSADNPCSPLYLGRLSPVKSKSLRLWYRSSAYAYNFPARRVDYMTDLKILQTYLRCEEEKEKYAQLCASSPTFWDYRGSMEYYSRVLMKYQYQVASLPPAPFTHRHCPPVKEKR